LTIGSVPLAPYTTPYTSKCAGAIRRLLDDHDALLLRSRGLLVLGTDLEAALERIERIENMAAALLGTKPLGQVNLLTGEHVRDLMSLRSTLRLGGRNSWAAETPDDHESKDQEEDGA
jgi:L-fuculose-phosphate aldolase